jgi:hypothetical protein
MDKDKAATLDGMMRASRMLLEAMAGYVRESVPEDQQQKVMMKIGTALGELTDISWMIYDEHPHLNPYPEETKLAAKMRNASRPSKRTD